MRKVFTLASLILIAAPLTAQDVAFRVGTAVNSRTMGGPTAASRSTTLVGMDFGLPLSETLALRPGVFRVSKSADVTTRVQDMEVSGGVSMDYVQIALPVQRTLRWGGDDSGRWSTIVQAGPWFALRSGCEVSGAVPRGAAPACRASRTERHPASSHVGLMMGVGLSHRLSGGNSVGIDMLMHRGFSDVLGGADAKRENTLSLALRWGLRPAVPPAEGG